MPEAFSAAMRDAPPVEISPEHLVAMLREIPIFISLIDEDDRLAWTSHSRVPLEEVIGKHVLELTEPALHAAVIGPGVGVLFTTGYGAGVLPEDIGRRTGVAILSKPYAMSELLDLVSRLVAGSAARASRRDP